MASTDRERRTITFGDFELDLNRRELRKDGAKVKLQDQPFQVLWALLERPGEVVTREELRQRIWPADTFVDFDHGLYNAVKRLREALGDLAERPRFVETLPRHGYRFIAPVSGNGGIAVKGGEQPTAKADKVQHQHRLRIPLVAATGLILLLIALVQLGPDNIWGRVSRRKRIPTIHSLAVLPLQSLSPDPSQEYFAEGMTDALITDLAQVGALRVVSRTTIMHYGHPDKPLSQIARELKVDAIVEGTVQRSGDRVRITAQLIHGPTDQHLWAQSFERDITDVLALQSTIASQIAREIQIKVTPEEHARLKTFQLVKPKALDAYVEARFHIEKASKLEYYNGKAGLQKEEFLKAASYLDRAAQEDPAYTPAYVAYFDLLNAPGSSELEFLPAARAALTKALQQKESDVTAHLALGRLLMQYDYDWSGAEKEYKSAIELSPNSGDAHSQYSEYLYNVGRNQEGDKERDLAQALDPAHDYFGDAGMQRLGRTLEQERQALEEQAPNDPFALAVMGKDYAIAGRFKESVQMYERSLRLLGWQNFANIMTQADAKAGAKFALQEWMRAGEEWEEQHGDMPLAAMAFTYASLGDKDHAFAWLQRAVKQRNWMIIYLKRDKVWDPLRSDPRFNALLRSVGLPQ